MSVLYVTSFSKDLYKTSGERMVRSFLINGKMTENLLICYENMEYENTAKNILTYNLNDSAYLNKWLSDNKDIIPDYLGGIATKTANPDIFNETHKRKASRFFRKVAALEYALNTYTNDYDHIMWIDCDCVFRRHLPTDYVLKHFGNNGFIYHQGISREKMDACFETGIMGFKKSQRGYEFLQRVIDYFANGSFKKHRRWDDGYIFKMVTRQSTDISSKDLAPKCNQNNVIKFASPFRDYIIHDKGLHRRAGIST